MKYPDDFINKIICGDCLEVMKGMPDNCIDTIITDPPYGIGFMGKEWDNFKNGSNTKKKWVKRNEYYIKREIYTSLDSSPAMKAGSYDLSPKGLIGFQEWMLGIAKEMLRVAKPGSTLLCFGGTRTYHRLACAIEDAGWVLKDCIMWLYGSGFPKATDISKNLDKMAKKKRKIIGKYELPDVADGKRKKGWECTNTTNIGAFGVSGQQNITAPATPEATLWNGWKSHGLKPAYEPILVAMKPNEGSYASNASKWGVAGLNIDGGRISFKDKLDEEESKGKNQHSKYPNSIMRNPAPHGIYHQDKRPAVDYTAKGRYPANVILNEEASRLLDEQSGVLKSGATSNNQTKDSIFGKRYMMEQIGSQGGASRFFYCAKASKAERNRGCEGLATKQKYNKDGAWNSHEIFSEYRTDPKTGELKKRKEADNDFKNHHPTVKPLSLMKYLCTITKTPTGGIVLDPFCGSGTTLMACKELKRDYIGIDNNPEYCEIARRRVDATPEPLF